MVVTPALAQRVIEEVNYKGQRQLAASHVAFLADEMRRGTFRAGTQIAFGRLGRDLHLVNGQHRMHALVQSGEDIEFQILIEDATDAEDLAALWCTFDRGGRNRSDAQVLAAHGISDRYGLSKTVARSIWQAQPLIANRFLRPSFQDDPTLRNDDLRMEGCKPWWEIGATYERLIEKAPSVVWKKLASSQAVAVALVTLKYQPTKAAEFWRGIASDDGLRRNDPRKALLIDFGNREWGRKSSDGCVSTSLAWNAFFTSRALSQIKIVNGAAVRIAGTPFDGRRG
jgi:hypothetical protein